MGHLSGLEAIKANDGQYHYGIRNDNGTIVADLAGFTNAKAIAQLFAAAPDLLTACKEAYEFLDDRTDTYPEPCEDVPALSVMITLKFAIAKAKGDQCTV